MHIKIHSRNGERLLNTSFHMSRMWLKQLAVCYAASGRLQIKPVDESMMIGTHFVLEINSISLLQGEH